MSDFSYLLTSPVMNEINAWDCKFNSMGAMQNSVLVSKGITSVKNYPKFSTHPVVPGVVFVWENKNLYVALRIFKICFLATIEHKVLGKMIYHDGGAALDMEKLGAEMARYVKSLKSFEEA